MDSTRILLLISHTLATWGNALWSFAIGLYFVILLPGSLSLTAVYGLVLAVSVLLLGSTIGFWIDHTPRLKAARTALLVQNGSVVICAAVLIALLSFSAQWEAQGLHNLVIVFQVIVVLIADVASLAAESQRLILERDWIVVISGQDHADLARMNSLFKSIYLIAGIAAPFLVGSVMSLLSPLTAAVFLAAWNIVSLTIEYILLMLILKKVPQLSVPRSQERKISENTPLLHSEKVEEVAGSGDDNKEEPHQKNWFFASLEAWKIYFTHPVFPAGFGLACLYMTVLGFDSVTTGYMYSQGVPEWMLGATTGIGSIFGIIGATIFPCFRACLGLPLSAITGFALLNILTSGAIVASFLPGSPFEVYTGFIAPSNASTNSSAPSLPTLPIEENMSIGTFIVCLVVARTGLWIADLSVTQSMQETIQPELRGEINGVQSSVNHLMEVIKFGLVTALPKPPVFGYLIISSECFTVFGWVCASYFAWMTWRNSRRTKDFYQTIPGISAGITDEKSNKCGEIGIVIEVALPQDRARTVSGKKSAKNRTGDYGSYVGLQESDTTE
ncbi:unnamed protein product [Notodromas monacha]|uniref:Solute carrier family 40 member n=1 Tax=Notodromas monacha TaxID=399045 RepID=A0A7R9BVE8_9CRUS|nr:unnamed protein product [Notodromas monacha]CAG0921500.1 unnamed protein product [Notodromas monacha]